MPMQTYNNMVIAGHSLVLSIINLSIRLLLVLTVVKDCSPAAQILYGKNKFLYAQNAQHLWENSKLDKLK